MMNVRDLIEKLSEIDPDYPVCVIPEGGNPATLDHGHRVEVVRVAVDSGTVEFWVEDHPHLLNPKARRA